MKVNLEQLEEMQKELFRQQCDLDIQKAMVKHFIKKEKDKQLILTDVVKSDSELLPKRLSNEAYKKAQVMSYAGFVEWWDEQQV
tara:strand:+ start:973 stop:1224 length:252 start_codon:yes stop_codon:yes gene_type:complete